MRGTYRQSMSSHVPMLCEEADVQYVYVHSKEQVGRSRDDETTDECDVSVTESGERVDENGEG